MSISRTVPVQSPAAAKGRHELRARAEAVVETSAPLRLADQAGVTIEEAQRMLHELQVHQIELEMQNEELRHAQMELDTERARYFDLYNLAPVGYCTVNEQGLVVQANLMVASLLGLSHRMMVKQRFSRFVYQEDQDLYYLLRQQLIKSGQPQSLELRLVRNDGAPFWSHIVATVAIDAKGAPSYRIVVSDMTERKRAQEELRIAATAFQCDSGIAVLDSDLRIMRANRAYTRLTGYAESELRGKTTAILRSRRHPAAFYEAIWNEVESKGSWSGDVWRKRKNGEEYLERGTITAIRGDASMVTHYVGYFTDATSQQLHEQQRLLDEAAQRRTLVREVHHRIKNNLQGVLGILRRYATQHPEAAPPLQHAIGQVQTISVIHGLQGRVVTAAVRIGELISAIALEIESLWQTPIALDIAEDCALFALAADEAVPIALVLNELILNGVKHSDKTVPDVAVAVRRATNGQAVRIRISNSGQFSNEATTDATAHNGLRLIAALMPHVGARIEREQAGERVVTWLELQPPVVYQDTKESICLSDKEPGCSTKSSL